MLRIIGIILCLAGLACAQAQPAQPTAPTIQPDLQSIVAKQFGTEFKLVPGYKLLTGDLDGDGTEDAVLVATTKDALSGELAYSFKVIDPYDQYFGWGNPKVTGQFSNTTVGDPKMLLIIHDWRAETAKAKFVVINLPFEKLSLGTTSLKKKIISAIMVEESSGDSAAIYWDGKKYKWTAR
jgi:hypothetical protein